MKEVAVIGAGGKMGSWFVNYFSHRNYQVYTYDSNRKSLRFMGNKVKVSDSISDCARMADLVLVCVPVPIAPRVIAECGKAMKSGAVIAEITSVKHKTFRALKELRSDVQPLCIHPMYGPGASDKKQLKMLLVPVKNEKLESNILRGIFADALLISLPDAESHDRTIAVVLSLPYFANIVFAKSIASEDIQRLKQFAGTTFTLQSLLAESVLTDEPDLIAALITESPASRKQIKRFLREAESTAKLVFSAEGESLLADIRKLKSRLQKHQKLQESYKRLYDILESVSG